MNEIDEPKYDILRDLLDELCVRFDDKNTYCEYKDFSNEEKRAVLKEFYKNETPDDCMQMWYNTCNLEDTIFTKYILTKIILNKNDSTGMTTENLVTWMREQFIKQDEPSIIYTYIKKKIAYEIEHNENS